MQISEKVEKTKSWLHFKKLLAIINSHNISNQISKIKTRIVSTILNLISDGCVDKKGETWNI